MVFHLVGLTNNKLLNEYDWKFSRKIIKFRIGISKGVKNKTIGSIQCDNNLLLMNYCIEYSSINISSIDITANFVNTLYGIKIWWNFEKYYSLHTSPSKPGGNSKAFHFVANIVEELLPSLSLHSNFAWKKASVLKFIHEKNKFFIF